MDLQVLLDECAVTAKQKGFEPTFPEFIALAHSELSEALEEFRKGYAITHEYVIAGKPEGIPPELADVVIRIAHYCGAHNIDLVGAIERKRVYNKTRPRMHGKIL